MLRDIESPPELRGVSPSGHPDPSWQGNAWAIHNLDRSLGGFTRDWDALNRRVHGGHPLLDSRFIDALLRHFGKGGERLFRFGSPSETSGLCILKRTGPGIWTTFRPPQTQLGPVILSNTSCLGKITSRLPGLAWQVDLLCQDPDLRPPLHCEDLAFRIMPHVLTINIHLIGGFAAYWDSRSSNLRRSMRGRLNRLAKIGLRSRLVRLEAPEEMSGGVERFGRLESTGWKGRAGTAVSSHNTQGRFYCDVLGRFARTGQAAIYEYWLGDRHAASELTLNNDRMQILLKTSYDEGLAEFGPGRLLLREIIRDGYSRFPGGVIEFYTNASSNELAWATGQRWMEHVSLYRSHLLGRLVPGLRLVRRLFPGQASWRSPQGTSCRPE